MAATGESLTYRQLEERSNQGAQLFRKLGLKAGDGIALFMENNIRFLEICWAAQRAGLYYTCISSRLTAGEVEYIVERQRREGADRRPQPCRRPPPKSIAAARRRRSCFMVGGTIPGYDSYEDAAGAMPATRIADETAGADMLYSSGTTGRPKGVRHPLSRRADRCGQRR